MLHKRNWRGMHNGLESALTGASEHHNVANAALGVKAERGLWGTTQASLQSIAVCSDERK